MARYGWKSLPDEIKEHALSFVTSSKDKKRFLDAVGVDKDFPHPMDPNNTLLIVKQLRTLRRDDPADFEKLKTKTFRKRFVDDDPSFAPSENSDQNDKRSAWELEHTKKLKLFIMAGARISPSDLEYYISNNYPTIVKLFIDSDRSLLVTPINTVGHYPLHRAVQLGYSRVLGHVLRHADVNAVAESSGETPLVLALHSVNMVKLLLQSGANVNAVSKTGGSVIHHAVNTPYVSPKVIDVLIQAGARVNDTRSHSHNTPLHDLALYSPLGYEDEILHVKVASRLLKNGADIHAINDKGQTPIDISRDNDMFPELYVYLKNIS